MSTSSDKIVLFEPLEQLRKHWRQQGKVVVFTNGCFDLLHRGHVEYLREAKDLGDLLIVGLNSDASVCDLKGPGRPLLPQDDRAHLLAALAAVDYVVMFDDPSVEATVARILPDILAKGGDYRPDQIVGAGIVERNGGQVMSLSLWKASSTTRLIAKAKASKL